MEFNGLKVDVAGYKGLSDQYFQNYFSRLSVSTNGRVLLDRLKIRYPNGITITPPTGRQGEGADINKGTFFFDIFGSRGTLGFDVGSADISFRPYRLHYGDTCIFTHNFL
jgi:hypothetical protein